ncbi:MAG: phytanoyl-CoA dioxygenase family protein [Acidimicrobiales bacterium]
MTSSYAVPAARPSVEACDLDDFIAVLSDEVDPNVYPLASEWREGVPVYECPRLDAIELQDELERVLLNGPGIVVLKDAVDPEAVDRASDVFRSIIIDEKERGEARGDHYAKPGANDRIWNALEKLAVADPDVFVDYYSSEAIAVAARAWLGPAYQVTSQVNVVNPGGEAQSPHRDYHLGFTTDAVASQYPLHAHLLSPVLTLQGAVAHGDMPVDTGPTMYLPHSHKYELGFLAWRRPEFIEYFLQNRVQLPLEKGDAVFFSPALFHAAGHNRTADVWRMANLLQISSAFGRAMETIDRTRMTTAIYPALAQRFSVVENRGTVLNAVAAAAEGYAFPTNLDFDQPVEGLAPPSQADLVVEALEQNWSGAELEAALAAQNRRRLSQ